jgi:sugar phosphate isomerase/epimerase
MRLSGTTWSFPALTLAEACAVWRALGIEAVDLGLLHRPALDRAAILADPDAAARALAPLGMRVANLYWLFGDGLEDRAVSDPAALEANLADLDAVLRFAAALGARSLFVLPGVLAPGVTRGAAMAAAAAALGAMTAAAARFGIALTVEPHVGGLLDSPARTLELVERTPGLRLTLDYAHFVCMGHPQAAVDALAPHAAHVHMRQARPGALQAKWGEGVIDLAAVVERLAEAGYDGFLSIEYVHQAYMNTLHDDVLTETVRMRDFLRSFGIA